MKLNRNGVLSTLGEWQPIFSYGAHTSALKYWPPNLMCLWCRKLAADLKISIPWCLLYSHRSQPSRVWCISLIHIADNNIISHHKKPYHWYICSATTSVITCLWDARLGDPSGRTHGCGVWVRHGEIYNLHLCEDMEYNRCIFLYMTYYIYMTY